MRKTRLVILPTKCLHQMGFLLLFLSCPVIGDWGRIRPESENSHNAIQIQREGTCGFERDPPGGLLGFLNENGSKQCRLSEDSDLIKPNAPAPETKRNLERRVDIRRMDVRRVDQDRKVRVSEKKIDDRKVRMTEDRRVDSRRIRMAEEKRIDNRRVRSEERRVDDRKVRIPEDSRIDDRRSRMEDRRVRMGERRVDDRRIRMAEEKRDIRRESERRVYSNVRSKSIEYRRATTNRNGVRVRSLSLSRLDNERLARTERSVPKSNENSRQERLQLSRRVSERQNQREVQQRRLNGELPIERRENILERRERETEKRESNRRSTPELSMRRSENDNTRRQSWENIQNVRERTENRLSLSRRENNARPLERTEIRQSSERLNLDRRVPDIRKIRSMEYLSGRFDKRENTSTRREIDSNRFVNASPKVFDRNFLERGNERVEGIRSRRVATIRTDNKPELSKEDFPGGITKWMDLTGYDNFKTGDWTTNCVIGAVVYFLTTRQVKAV